MKNDSARRALARKFLKLQDEIEHLQARFNSVRAEIIKEGSFQAGPYIAEVKPGSRRIISVRMLELKHQDLFAKLLALGLVNLVKYPTVNVNRRNQ